MTYGRWPGKPAPKSPVGCLFIYNGEHLNGTGGDRRI